MSDSQELFRRWIELELAEASKNSYSHEFDIRKRANVRVEYLQATLALLDEFSFFSAERHHPPLG